MSESFTPLTPAVLASGGKFTAASAAPATPASAAFQPLMAPGNASAKPGNCTAKPSVILLRKGNVVTSIRIQCACGQLIELNCQY
jgi:hypothetical protein